MEMVDLSAGKKLKVIPDEKSSGLSWSMLTPFLLIDVWFCWLILQEPCLV